MGHSRTTHRTTSLPLRAAAVAVIGGAALLMGGPVKEARADDSSAKGKGVAGGALLGAEAVTIVESLAGVRAGWAYAVGAIAGAGGGGVGGYFIGKGSDDGKAPTYMLAGGLALVIPALVLTLNATRYMPEEGATEDRVPTAPAAEPGVPGETPAPSPPTSPSGPPGPTPPGAGTPVSPGGPPPPPPQSLLDLHRGALRIGVPVPDVRPVYTVAERRQYGMRDETELRLPVLHIAF